MLQSSQKQKFGLKKLVVITVLLVIGYCHDTKPTITMVWQYSKDIKLAYVTMSVLPKKKK